MLLPIIDKPNIYCIYIQTVVFSLSLFKWSDFQRFTHNKWYTYYNQQSESRANAISVGSVVVVVRIAVSVDIEEIRGIGSISRTSEHNRFIIVWNYYFIFLALLVSDFIIDFNNLLHSTRFFENATITSSS